MDVRCVQCGWTIAPDRYDDVWLDDQRIPLHKGGCPGKPKHRESFIPRRVTR